MLSFYLSLLESLEDQQVFTDLYTENHVHIEKYVLYLLKNQHDAEDALQNTFVQVAKHFDIVHTIPKEQRSYWLRAIAKNEALMIMRANRKTTPVDDWTFLDETASVERASDWSELVELFTKLPETYRQTLELKFLLGYSGKEIAQRLGITESVVNTRISRGRAMLKKIIEKEGLL